MRRQHVALALALGLGLLGSFGAAWAAPDWNASAGQTFPFQVIPTPVNNTWSFAVSILPQAPAGYAIKGFFVYPETPTPVTPVSAYKDWNFGQPGNNALFGWSGSGPPSYLQKGETATFVVSAPGLER